jgi:hypothetical protein
MPKQLGLFDAPVRASESPPEPRRSLPYQRYSETSRAAAESASRIAETGRRIVLTAIRRAGIQGLTDPEIQWRTGLSESTERPRRVELVRDGVVVDSGRARIPRGRNRACTVWVLAKHAEGVA